MAHKRIEAVVFLMVCVGLAPPSVVTAQGIPTVHSDPEIQALRERAENGDSAARYNLGEMYAFGRGVPQDDAQALAWYRLAADQGLATAQNNLGVMYADGRGVPQDDAQAVAWFRLAADQGHAGSQFNVGVMYFTGRGVPEDDAQAARWFRLAADQGDAKAQFNLWVMSANGRGVPQDLVEAHKWIILAASRVSGADRTRYAETRDAVAKLISPEQIAEAQERARVWQPAEQKTP